jgi:predicted short-subunit dehydrogenase-like oxidoreductase (DUF2520 family)
LTLTVGPVDVPPPWIGEVDVVVLAVADDGIVPLTEMLAARSGVGPRHVVLHLSGSRDHSVLAALAASGAAVGSLHPLQTLVDPVRAPDHLRGAWAAVEGMPHAVATADRLARDIGLRPFRVRPEDKLRYHAAAVFASNYFVVVEAIAERLLRQAGLPDDAWAALLPLVAGTLDNLRREGPVGALTGPVARGDAETLAGNLSAIGRSEAALYRALGTVALELARMRGLDEERAAQVARALATDLRPERPAGG